MRAAPHHPERATARTMLALAASLLVLLGTLAAAHGTASAAPPAAGTSPIKLTALHAGISYQGGQGTMPVWTDIRVTIVRNGTTVLSKAALPAAVSKSFYKAPVMQVFDFEDDAEPEVLIDVATIGDDCCKRSVIYHYDGSSYTTAVIDWGNATYTLKNVVPGVGPEFVTTDPRVPLAFGSKATGPLRILQLRKGVLVDVTSKAKSLVKRDARLQQRAWKTASRAGAAAPLAAYVVDLIRLGKTKDANAAIATAARKKQLGGATPAKWGRSLGTRAVRWGYVKRSPLG